MAGEYVFNLQHVTKMYGKETIVEDVNLAFFFGAKIGVIGGNGSGKSTILKILAGLDTNFMGTRIVAKSTKIGYLPQEPQLDESLDVAGNVAQGMAEAQALLDRYDEICDKMSENLPEAEMDKLGDEMSRLQDIIDTQDLWDLEHTLEMEMAALNLPPPDTDVSTLSGGEKRRVALCRLLISSPDVLLLDEPTNHLDAESVAWLEGYLKKYTGTIVVVTHDRYFLNNVTEWILEMENTRALPFKGNYTTWLEQKEKIMAIQNKQAASKKKLLAQELAWVRLNASGRLAKSKARITRYDELSKQEANVREDSLAISIPPGPRLGDKVVVAQDLAMAYGDNAIMSDVTFDLPRGGIVGIIGANGAGKTTLFKMIVGQLQPTAGTLSLGESVVVSYVDQMRDDLDANKSVYEEISGGEDSVQLGNKSMNSRAYCSRFNFKRGDQQQSVGSLSGGERNRVHLAKLLKSGGNLLLLDEPSNDLDVSTLRALEEALQEFGGCAVVISHDRWFLDRIATHILAFEGNGKTTWCDGNYTAYEEMKARTSKTK